MAKKSKRTAKKSNKKIETSKKQAETKINIEDINKDVNNIKEENADEIATKVSSTANDVVDWKNPKELGRNFLYGIFMGISDAVPGYSGGTTLSIIGFYQQLISNFKNIFKPKIWKDFWKYLLWFLPFAIAWAVMLIIFMLIVNKASSNNTAIILVFLFASFAIFSIPLFYLSNKNKLTDYTQLPKELKNKNKDAILTAVLFGIGFLLMLIIALVVRFASYAELSTGEKAYGVTFQNSNYENYFYSILSSGNVSKEIILFMVAGFLSGFCMLIPGISGSLVTYMFGLYPKISWCISNFFNNSLFSQFNNSAINAGQHEKNWGDIVPYPIVFIIAVIIGIITSTFVINWLFKKHEKHFMNFSFGLVSCSFLTIFISLSSKDYETLNNVGNIVGSIMMIPLAILINAGLFVWLNETNKINFPKYKIKNLKKTFLKK